LISKREEEKDGGERGQVRERAAPPSQTTFPSKTKRLPDLSLSLASQLFLDLSHSFLILPVLSHLLSLLSQLYFLALLGYERDEGRRGEEGVCIYGGWSS
jgi:hypothetical protein